MDPLPIGRDVRASDADRERVADALRRHYAAGRLETHELDQRLGAAYRARWRHELRALTRDLPFDVGQLWRELDRGQRALRGDLRQPPLPGRFAEALDRGQRAALHAHAALWVMLNLVVFAIWAWAGAHSALAPVVLVLTTALLVSHARASRQLSRRLSGPRTELPRRPRPLL